MTWHDVDDDDDDGVINLSNMAARRKRESSFLFISLSLSLKHTHFLMCAFPLSSICLFLFLTRHFYLFSPSPSLSPVCFLSSFSLTSSHSPLSSARVATLPQVVGHTPQACVNAASVGGRLPPSDDDDVSSNNNEEDVTAGRDADDKSSAIHNAYSTPTSSSSPSPSPPVFTDAKSSAESWDGSGVIWRIDTGASSGIANGPREALEVILQQLSM